MMLSVESTRAFERVAMLGVDFDLVARLKFIKTRKEEPTKGKGLVYSWENFFRQPTKNGFVVIAQKWGQVLQHSPRCKDGFCLPLFWNLGL